ncbi:MAG: GNAT family N-acetyltransferase [Pseudomonadota bacterium]
MITVRHARGTNDLDAVRQLCWAYRDILVARTTDLPGLVDHYYATPIYQEMMDELPGKHVPPDGEVFVALKHDQIIACGMTHRIDAATCEIKRVYVTPEGRGKGVARQLCSTAMDWAKAAGYTRFVLDTMRRLPEAMALYEGMGFTRAAPYHELPPDLAQHIVFYEHPL